MKTKAFRNAAVCGLLAALIFGGCEQPSSSSKKKPVPEEPAPVVPTPEPEPAPVTEFTAASIEAMSAFLADSPENSAANPYRIVLDTAEPDAAALAGIFDALNGRYVSLDLSSRSWRNIPATATADIEARKHRDKLVALVLPASLESIGDYAFSGSSNLGALTFTASEAPAGSASASVSGAESAALFSAASPLLTIGDYAFSKCVSLKAADLSAVKEVGENAFYGCSALESVVFSPSLTKIGGAAFYKCSSLASCFLGGDTPAELGNYAFTETDGTLAFYFDDAKSLSLYSSDANWSLFKDSFVLQGSGDMSGAEIYFDYGRRRALARSPVEEKAGGTGYYTMIQGNSLVLAPVRTGIGKTAAYSWKLAQVNGGEAGTYTAVPAAGEYFTFTPASQGTYSVVCTAVDGKTTVEAQTLVYSLAGGNPRPVSAASKRKAQYCFEFTPAPGQFVGVYPKIDFSDASTEEAVREKSEAKLQGKEILAGPYYDGWSLNDVGGYLTVGFDHSIKKIEKTEETEGGNEISIKGNAFGSWNEPGIVWVSRDDNGNEIADDTWYELKGSEYGSADTVRRYAVTYYRPAAGNTRVKWADNQGDSGEISNYPYSVKGPFVTLVGTKLPLRTTTGATTGYADTSDTRFSIADAVQADGSAIDLPFIDFVKVQTAVRGTAFGGISTELSAPEDASMPMEAELSGQAAGSGYRYTFINNSGYPLTIAYQAAGDDGENGDPVTVELGAGKTHTFTLPALKINWEISGGNAGYTANDTTGTLTFRDFEGDV
jgi:hypothetical protein